MKKHGYLIALLIMVISLLIASIISLIMLKPANKPKKTKKKENYRVKEVEKNNTGTYEILLNKLYSDCNVKINDYINLDQMSNDKKINTAILNLESEEIKVNSTDEIDMTGCNKKENIIISSNLIELDINDLSNYSLYSGLKVDKEFKNIFGKGTVINHQTTGEIFYDKTANSYILAAHGCDNYESDWFQKIINTKEEGNYLYIDVIVGSLINLLDSKTKICYDYQAEENTCILLSEIDKKYSVKEDDYRVVDYEKYALDNKDKFAKYRYTFEKEDNNYVIKKLEKID